MNFIELPLNPIEFWKFKEKYGKSAIGFFIGDEYVYLIPTLKVDE